MYFRILTFVLAALVCGDTVHAAVAAQTATSSAWEYLAPAFSSPEWLVIAVFGATLATDALTLMDLAKRLDPDDQVARIIELLAQTNQILDDCTWMEGNLVTGHRTTVRTGLPAVAWRMMNAGTVPSKSHTAQIDEQVGMLDAWSQVDKALAELGGNAGAVRLSEARAFLEAMNQEFAQTLFYGAAASPEEFVGLSPRYSSLSAGNADNIIDGLGTGSDNTSIWLIAWDPETITGIYPQGSNAGLSHEDLGVDTVENAGGVTGALMRAYRDHWMWHAGIALKDWRFVVRIPNIDVSELSVAATRAKLLTYMADAEERIPNELGRRAFYMNRTVRRNLRHATTEAVGAGGGITFENVAGKRVAFFGVTPVRISDALINAEARVV
jgi:hypothetical protein